MLSYPTPPLLHAADESLVVRVGNVLFPGMLEVAEGGVRVEVDAPMPNPFALEMSQAMFDFVLGVLRAWRPTAGVLRCEVPSLHAPGALWDDAGNRWVQPMTAMGYGTVGDEVIEFAARARVAKRGHEHLRRALMLNGRARRTGADFYMIHEYAEMEFQGMEGVRDALGVSVKKQKKLRRSACNLSPFEGGRHATGDGKASMDVDAQRDFIADLLRRWVEHVADP